MTRECYHWLKECDRLTVEGKQCEAHRLRTLYTNAILRDMEVILKRGEERRQKEEADASKSKQVCGEYDG